MSGVRSSSRSTMLSKGLPKMDMAREFTLYLALESRQVCHRLWQSGWLTPNTMKYPFPGLNFLTSLAFSRHRLHHGLSGHGLKTDVTTHMYTLYWNEKFQRYWNLTSLAMVNREGSFDQIIDTRKLIELQSVTYDNSFTALSLKALAPMLSQPADHPLGRGYCWPATYRKPDVRCFAMTIPGKCKLTNCDRSKQHHRPATCDQSLVFISGNLAAAFPFCILIIYLT